MPCVSLFANTCDTCDDINDDEHDLDDLFEDVELMKIDAQVYWSLKLREKALYISIVHIFQVTL
jgi:hypothetical protein